MELLSKAHQAETARFAHEKQFSISQLEDEKGLLVDRISKLERLLDEKCEESRSQHQHSIHLAAEQKVTLGLRTTVGTLIVINIMNEA